MAVAAQGGVGEAGETVTVDGEEQEGEDDKEEVGDGESKVDKAKGVVGKRVE